MKWTFNQIPSQQIELLSCYLEVASGDCCNRGCPSKMILKLKSHVILFAHNLFSRCPIFLLFSTGHSNDIALLFVKFQNDWDRWFDVINEWVWSLRWILRDIQYRNSCQIILVVLQNRIILPLEGGKGILNLIGVHLKNWIQVVLNLPIYSQCKFNPLAVEYTFKKWKCVCIFYALS